MADTWEGLVGSGLLTRELEAIGNWQGPQSEGQMSGALTGKPTLDFEVHQGCYRRLTISVLGDDSVPVNLTGFQVDWVVNCTPIEKSSVMGAIEVLDQVAEPGKCRIEINGVDTFDTPAGRYFHQLLVTDTANRPDIVLEGWLTLKINITDD